MALGNDSSAQPLTGEPSVTADSDIVDEIISAPYPIAPQRLVRSEQK